LNDRETKSGKNREVWSQRIFLRSNSNSSHVDTSISLIILIIPRWLISETRYRALAHVVTASKFGKRRTFGKSPPCFGLLCFGELRGSAHVLPALSRTTSTLAGAGAGADQVAPYIGEAAQFRQHQAPGAGAGVDPRLR
jgi:hypothetical protein